MNWTSPWIPGLLFVGVLLVFLGLAKWHR